MTKIIKITPVEDTFTVTWTMHVRCNYDCMYCPPSRHDDYSELPSLENLQSKWQQIYDKTSHIGRPYKIVLSGGEPTANKNLLPFVVWLRTTFKEKIHSIGMVSNGSASANHYLKLFEYLIFKKKSIKLKFKEVEFKFNMTPLILYQYELKSILF